MWSTYSKNHPPKHSSSFSGQSILPLYGTSEIGLQFCREIHDLSHARDIMNISLSHDDYRLNIYHISLFIATHDFMIVRDCSLCRRSTSLKFYKYTIHQLKFGGNYFTLNSIFSPITLNFKTYFSLALKRQISPGKDIFPTLQNCPIVTNLLSCMFKIMHKKKTPN